MKNLIYLIIITFIITSCGAAEKIYGRQNYEFLTNEKGNVFFYSGGKMIKEYKQATILYSSADTQAMFITTREGRIIYLQGDIIIDL